MMNFRAKDWNWIEIHRFVAFWQASYFGLRFGIRFNRIYRHILYTHTGIINEMYKKMSMPKNSSKNDIEKCWEQKLYFTWIQRSIMLQRLVYNLEGALLFCSRHFSVSFFELSFCIAFIRKFVVHLDNMCTLCRLQMLLAKVEQNDPL